MVKSQEEDVCKLRDGEARRAEACCEARTKSEFQLQTASCKMQTTSCETARRKLRHVAKQKQSLNFTQL